MTIPYEREHRIGSHVRTASRGRAVGTIVRHHPTLPAWIVRFGREAFPLAYFYDELAEEDE